MTSVYSKDLQIYTAKQFKKSVATSNVYLTFGYQRTWQDELNPPQANTSSDSVYETWRYMLGGKKINGSDVHHMIRRFNWVSGNTYCAYDNTIDSLTLKNGNTQFYVVTDDCNVYKCIANNYNKPSTYKPASTNPGSQFETADQYVWKYMYTLTAEEQLRFLTGDYIPVKTLESDDNSLQWQVQQDAIPGAIHSILVTNGGEGFVYEDTDVTVTIQGDGRFANAYAVVDPSIEQITRIIVDQKGAGYTYANVIITSPIGVYAEARAVIAPPGGHGSDALSELGGSYLLINADFNGSERGTIIAQNDYRQVAIVENPHAYGTTNTTTNLSFSQVTSISLSQSSSISNYFADEIVYQGPDLGNATFSGVVASWDLANSLIKLTNVVGSPTAALLTGYTSTTSRYLSSILQPDLQPYTGHLLYKDNITPITRAEDQNEDFKIILSF